MPPHISATLYIYAHINTHYSHMTLFACLQAAAFVGPLTYPQQPETSQDGGVCVSTYMWVWVCVWVCVCVWSPPQTNPKREGTAPYPPPPPYIVPTILYITWALNTFAPSGAAQSPGGGGCWISALVFITLFYMFASLWSDVLLGPPLSVAAAGRS